MKKLAILAALVAAVSTLMILPIGRATPAQAALVTNVKVPVAIGVLVPCAPDFVVLTGNLHILITFEDDGAGGFHGSSHFDPQGVSGTSVFTGDKYQGTGVTRQNFSVQPPFPFETTFVNNFRIIGQGPGNNLLVHANTHLTIDANGNVTATVANVSISCK